MFLTWLLAALAACSNLGTQPEVAARDEPTVIMVIGCTLRASRLGIYGNRVPTSPYIDDLARNGTRFSRMLSNAPWTRPGIAALTTGRHPLTLGVDDQDKELNLNRGIAPEITTLAERFQQRGWTTLGITGNPNANGRFGFAQGFTDYQDTSAKWREKITKPLGSDLVDELLTKSADVDGPLYGQLVLVDPHRPLYSLPYRRWKLGYPLFTYGRLVHRYDAAVTQVDDAIKALDEGLRAQGRQNRVLMIVGDHGEGLFRPRIAGRSHARYLYDANLNVPWILNGPGVAKDHVVQGLAESIDVIPTLFDLLGIDPDAELMGTSWGEQVRGESKKTNKKEMLSVTRYGPIDKARLTTPTWTYIHNFAAKKARPRGKEELYHHLDFKHRENQIRNHPARAAIMEARLMKWRSDLESQAVIWETEASNMDLEQLRALGYVD